MKTVINAYSAIMIQTDEEKFEMYNKLTKDQIIKMLIESNRIIDQLTRTPTIIYPPVAVPALDPYYRPNFYTTCHEN